MKVSWVVFSILIASALAAAYFAFPISFGVSPVSEPPHGLVISPEVCDLGPMPQHTRGVARYGVENRSGGPVELTAVDSGCGCTRIVVGERHLADSTSTQIEVTFDAGAARGDVLRYLELEYVSPDGTPGRRRLILKAFVQADVLLEPGELEFAVGRTGRADFSVRPGMLDRVEVKSVVPTHASLVATPSGQDPRRITVEYTPSVDGGERLRPVFVLVATNSPNEPHVHLPVRFTDTAPQGER